MRDNISQSYLSHYLNAGAATAIAATLFQPSAIIQAEKQKYPHLTYTKNLIPSLSLKQIAATLPMVIPCEFARGVVLFGFGLKLRDLYMNRNHIEKNQLNLVHIAFMSLQQGAGTALIECPTQILPEIITANASTLKLDQSTNKEKGAEIIKLFQNRTSRWWIVAISLSFIQKITTNSVLFLFLNSFEYNGLPKAISGALAGLACQPVGVPTMKWVNQWMSEQPMTLLPKMDGFLARSFNRLGRYGLVNWWVSNSSSQSTSTPPSLSSK